MATTLLRKLKTKGDRLAKYLNQFERLWHIIIFAKMLGVLTFVRHCMPNLDSYEK